MMQGFMSGVWIFLGIIAGILVQLGVGWFNNSEYKKRKANNLKFELQFNLKKIDTWLIHIGKLKECLSGDLIAIFYEHFDMSSAIFVTANDMLSTGLLYETLGHEDIERLQNAASELSVSSERIYWDAIRHWKDALPLARQNDVEVAQALKEDAVKQVDFWGVRLREHQTALRNIVEKL